MMKKGIIQVFISNIFYLLFGIINNFILPKYLSVEAYSELKTYMLYLSYVGFASFGFADGMFLIYGGRTLKEAKDNGFGNNYITYVGMQSLISTAVVVLGAVMNSSMVILIGLSFFASNSANYIKMFCTATGEFKTYSILTSLEKVAVLLFNVIFLFAFHRESYEWYSLVIIGVFVIETIYSNIVLNRKERHLLRGGIKVDELNKSIGIGFVLLLGSLVSSVFVGIDQFFVKFMNDTTAFAVYAFAVSMERLIALFISPISTTLYSFFCRNNSEKDFKFLQEGIMLWGALLLVISFPLKFVIEHFIASYIDSVSLIYLLFASEVFYCLVGSIYINLYKARKETKKYLIQMIVMCIVSVLLNYAFYNIWNNLESIALGTLVTKMIWLVVCEVENKETRFSMKANLYMGIMMAVFVGCALTGNWLISTCVFVVAYFVISLLMMKESFIRVIHELISMMKIL